MLKKRSNWLGAWSLSACFHAIVLILVGIFGIHSFSDMPKSNEPIELALVNMGGGGGGPAPEAVQEMEKELPKVEPIRPIEQEEAPPIQTPTEESIATEHKEAPAPVKKPGSSARSDAGGSGTGSGTGDGSGTGTGTGSGSGSGNGSGIGDGDGNSGYQNPQLLSNPSPPYPPSARRNEIEGTVVVGLTISVNGTVESVWINSSSGSDILDQAALKAVAKWRFVPAKRGNQAIETTTSVPVQFNLRNA